MKLTKVPPIEHKLVNVIIETPRGNQNKFNYDPELELFRLKKTLPMGMVFPFDFGFIPNTLAEDGDPADVLVIMDQQGYAGCLVQCRPIGVIEATQTEGQNESVRNDRIIAVAASSQLYAAIESVKELNENMAAEIETFFVNYNKHEGKVFSPLRWAGAHAAVKLIKRLSVYGK